MRLPRSTSTDSAGGEVFDLAVGEVADGSTETQGRSQGNRCAETSGNACALVVCSRVIAMGRRSQGRQAMHRLVELKTLDILPTDAQSNLAQHTR